MFSYNYDLYLLVKTYIVTIHSCYCKNFIKCIHNSKESNPTSGYLVGFTLNTVPYISLSPAQPKVARPARFTVLLRGSARAIVASAGSCVFFVIKL